MTTRREQKIQKIKRLKAYAERFQDQMRFAGSPGEEEKLRNLRNKADEEASRLEDELP